jgi:non-heme chloroperoxidase
VLPLTYEQFCYAFANAVSEEEAHQLDDDPDRGPLLIISGEQDHTVPWAIANASFQQQANPGVTEIVEIKGRGHALTIDSGWREVADTTLAFVQRFTLIGA